MTLIQPAFKERTARARDGTAGTLTGVFPREQGAPPVSTIVPWEREDSGLFSPAWSLPHRLLGHPSPVPFLPCSNWTTEGSPAFSSRPTGRLSFLLRVISDARVTLSLRESQSLCICQRPCPEGNTCTETLPGKGREGRKEGTRGEGRRGAIGRENPQSPAPCHRPREGSRWGGGGAGQHRRGEPEGSARLSHTTHPGPEESYGAKARAPTRTHA